MVNSLTRETGARLGPLLFETLVKHYFERLAKESLVRNGVTVTTKLRKEELLYDEAYIIVKTFLEAASKHPVEELQRFSNTRTPSPPWVRVVRLVVPMSCCDDAAEVLVKALGGEAMTKRLVGGTKWWQVRGVKGVDAEWIATKKDWQESEKKYKAHEKDKDKDKARSTSTSTSSSPEIDGEEPPAEYDPSMDEMRCILYSHGGGYYFGSVDQERYAIQRLARKINGRVFAINYRLAPQYPFPCGLQDLIAAYLFLIRPPEGSAHRPVKPEHIIVSGDSAGGGLTLALLQVLRDCDLPLPAGGVLVSPWCDLTHSFPSIHINTATDVIPPYGLSFYKPSTLWPPPPDDMTVNVREGLRSRIRQAVTLTKESKSDVATLATQGNNANRSRSCSRLRPASPLEGEHDLRLPQTGQTLHLGSTASLPTVAAGVKDQTVHCVTESGEHLSIHEQIHLYTPNYLLAHPLVSPAISYMGGLPPLLVIAGDAEVLRDEIIYLAHKAAHPEKYPISQEAKDMYPALNGIEERINRPTPVHLQVYDDAAHVLPILFSFTTPAKYCFRAMALFIRQVTGMMPSSTADSSEEIDIPITLSPPDSPDADDVADGSTHSLPVSQPQSDASRLSRPTSTTPHARSSPPSRDPSPVSRRRSLFRGRHKVGEDEANGVVTTSSMKRSFRRSIFRGSAEPSRERHSSGPVSDSDDSPRASSIDVGGPRFRGSGLHHDANVRRAGEEAVYQNGLTEMIRERVSTHGVIRPLEPESELAAFSLPHERIGQVSELAMRRYFDAKTKFDKKFGGTYKSIEKHRLKHIEKAKKDAMRNMAQLQNYINQDEKREGDTLKGVKDGLVASGSWSWAWALDVDEKPPPSSIVARRDTHEAVELARIADQAVLADENMLSGNSLWSLMVNFLTVVPDKEKRKEGHLLQCVESRESKRERVRSRFAQVFTDLKKHHRSTAGAPPVDSPVTVSQETRRTSVSSTNSAHSDHP